MRGTQFLSRWLWRLTNNRKRRRAVIVGKRHGKGSADRIHSGQRREFGQNLFEELPMFFRLRVFRFWQNEFSDERMLRIKAWLGRAKIGEAFDQQTGAREKQQRQRHLRDDEQSAEMMRLRSDRAAVSLLERLVHIWPRHLQRRHQGEENRAENCSGECE